MRSGVDARRRSERTSPLSVEDPENFTALVMDLLASPTP
jgi:hypothetical protein